MKRIYLDYAATTPVDPRVLHAMDPYFSTSRGARAKFGNPGSLHSFGQEAISAIDRSRERIARAVGAEFREIIFTGSATEANNLAIRSASRSQRVVISAIEHESVLETARSLERDGVEVVIIPVDRRGIADLQKLRAALDEKTRLVSIMYANNEIGSIQPIAEIARMVRAAAPNALIHTDAAQAFQFLDCDVTALNVDLMTLSSHKIYGPKGAAALYIKSGTTVAPLIFGGGQEFGLRSGTENVPAIVGFARATELALVARAKESKRVASLRDHLARGIRKIYPRAEINGTGEGIAGKKNAPVALPNILNVYFPGYEAQDLLTRFDLAGLAVSSGSACRSRAFESSYVIEAIGHSKERAKASIRFSLGRPTTKTDIATALKIIQMQLFSKKSRMI